MAEAEVKKRTRRTRKKSPEVAPEAASLVSDKGVKQSQPEPVTEPGATVTKLPNGLVIVSR